MFAYSAAVAVVASGKTLTATAKRPYNPSVPVVVPEVSKKKADPELEALPVLIIIPESWNVEEPEFNKINWSAIFKFVTFWNDAVPCTVKLACITTLSWNVDEPLTSIPPPWTYTPPGLLIVTLARSDIEEFINAFPDHLVNEPEVSDAAPETATVAVVEPSYVKALIPVPWVKSGKLLVPTKLPPKLPVNEPVKLELAPVATTFPALLMLLDTIKDPVIWEFVFTLNPKSGAIEAVTEPLAIWDKFKPTIPEAGTFVNPPPSPANEPVNEPVNVPLPDVAKEALTAFKTKLAVCAVVTKEAVWAKDELIAKEAVSAFEDVKGTFKANEAVKAYDELVAVAEYDALVALSALAAEAARDALTAFATKEAVWAFEALNA